MKDFDNPEIDRICAQYVRGSNDMGHVERIKIMKLLWDATGTEFGGRHALYELNYAGAPEEVRLQVLKGAERGGRLKAMEELVDTCMADYDENGWTGDTWLPPLASHGGVTADGHADFEDRFPRRHGTGSARRSTSSRPMARPGAAASPPPPCAAFPTSRRRCWCA